MFTVKVAICGSFAVQYERKNVWEGEGEGGGGEGSERATICMNHYTRQ